MVGAAVEKFARLYSRGELPDRPTHLAVIARNAAIDELRRLESRSADSSWAFPASDGVALERAEHEHDFSDDALERITAATRAGCIMGSQLTPRERRVIRLRANGKTLAEIATDIGVVRSRVHQILDGVLNKL